MTVLKRVQHEIIFIAKKKSPTKIFFSTSSGNIDFMTRINYSANAGTHNTKAKVVVAVVRQIATSLAICVTVRNRRVVSVVVPTTTTVDCEFVKQTR